MTWKWNGIYLCVKFWTAGDLSLRTNCLWLSPRIILIRMANNDDCMEQLKSDTFMKRSSATCSFWDIVVIHWLSRAACVEPESLLMNWYKECTLEHKYTHTLRKFQLSDKRQKATKQKHTKYILDTSFLHSVLLTVLLYWLHCKLSSAVTTHRCSITKHALFPPS